MSRADRLRIANACSASWEAMEGDEKSRFCPECGKHVYNISAMKRAEVSGLMVPDAPLPCMRGVCDSDGYLMTAGKLAAVTRRSFSMVVAGAMAGIVPVAALAQADGVVVSGIVRDVTGEGIPNAPVTLINIAKGENFETHTDESGAFSLSRVPHGTYALKAVSPGFESFRREKIEIGSENVTLSIQLQVGSVGEVVTVKRKLKLPAFLKGK